MEPFDLAQDRLREIRDLAEILIANELVAD
jgi:hypothetical protein